MLGGTGYTALSMHPALPLLSFLLAQAEPAPAAESFPVSVAAPAAPAPAPESFPVSIAAAVAGGLSRQGDSHHGEAGEGQIAVDWFARRPVVDDGTPLSLQPYLQRADRLSLGVEGSLAGANNNLSPFDYSDKSVAARLVGLFYRKWSVFGGEVDYARFSGNPSQILRPSVTFGVRDKTFELRLSYAYSTYLGNGAVPGPGWGQSYIFSTYFDDGTFRRPGWGQGKALATIVLDDLSYFNLAAFALVDGGGASAKYETFPKPKLGIWLAIDFQEEETNYFDGVNFSTVGYAMAHGEVGVEWWHSNHFALLGSLSGGMIRETLQPRSAYGTETTNLELVANLGIVTRIYRRKPEGHGAPSAE